MSDNSSRSDLPWRDASPFSHAATLVVIIGLFLSLFDLLRKTIFLNASWNYNYLPFQFVYNPLALAALLLLLLLAVLFFPRAVDLPPPRFAAALFGFGIVLFTLGLFALPLELTKALHVDKRGLYNAAVFLVHHGPLDLLASFHQLEQTAPPAEYAHLYAVESLSASQQDVAATHFATWFSSLDWVPFNEAIAAYVDEYTTQKHGPVSVFMIAPFLLLVTSTGAALIGNVLLVALTPVVGYYTFRLYFSDLVSRIAAVSIAVGPGLFIWTRHAAPVPYDAFTALLVGGATYLFLRGVQSDECRFFLGAGVILSLAALTKLTALVMGLPFLLVLLWVAPNLPTAARHAAETAGAWLVVPVTFLLAGYNFVAQYLYTIYKLTLHKIQYPGGGGRPADNPAAALEQPLIGLLGTLYNLRWMNVVLCVLAVAFVVLLVWDRELLRRAEHVASAAFLTAFLPYGVWLVFGAGTLSRHTVMLSVPLGFVACSALSALLDHSPDIDRTRVVRFGQVALLIGALQFVINV